MGLLYRSFEKSDIALTQLPSECDEPEGVNLDGGGTQKDGCNDCKYNSTNKDGPERRLSNSPATTLYDCDADGDQHCADG